MPYIQLSQGLSAFVDLQDYERVSQHKWSSHNGLYAYRSLPRNKQPQKHQLLHRFILDAPESHRVDHIDGNGLNNSRKNLRLCAHWENLHNRISPKLPSSSQYRGVSFHKASGLWRGFVQRRGRRIFHAYFKSEREAAETRDFVARQLIGDFAVLNFPA